MRACSERFSNYSCICGSKFRSTSGGKRERFSNVAFAMYRTVVINFTVLQSIQDNNRTPVLSISFSGESCKCATQYLISPNLHEHKLNLCSAIVFLTLAGKHFAFVRNVPQPPILTVRRYLITGMFQKRLPA